MNGMNVASHTRTSSPDDGGFQHEVMLYAGQEQFVDRTARFVQAGLGAGRPVLIAVAGPRAELLRRELGADAERVDFLDMASVGRNPARIIPAWWDWVGSRAGSGPGPRVVGEAVWAGRTEAEITECEQHELLLGPAFGQGPGWQLICPYDTEALPVEVVARFGRTHGLELPAGQPWTGVHVPHPASKAAAGAFPAGPLPEPVAAAYQLAFGRDQLPGVRSGVVAQAEYLGLAGQRLEDLVLVVSELASNSVRHGGGEGTLRVWLDGADLVCEVRDRGHITDPLVGRRRPDIAAAQGGAGLWITNQLCDLVQIRSTAQTGTVVRVRIALPEASAAAVEANVSAEAMAAVTDAPPAGEPACEPARESIREPAREPARGQQAGALR